MTTRSIAQRLVLSAGLFVAAHTHAQQASITLVAPLSGSVPGSQALGISADGSTVVGLAPLAGGAAFRWRAETGMVSLGSAVGSGQMSKASAVNANGSVIAGEGFGPLSTNAFRWVSGSGVTNLGDLPGGFNDSYAFGCDASGNTVVGRTGTAEGIQAFAWTPTGGMTPLGDIPGGNFSSIAYAVSADSSTIVGVGMSDLGGEACKWTSTGVQGLGDLPGGPYLSRAYAVNADGSVIVGEGRTANGSGIEAFRWTQDTGMVSLGDLPGGAVQSIAYGVSANGNRIVGVGTADLGATVSGAFLWTPEQGMRSLWTVMQEAGVPLAAQGWLQFTIATGISADGTRICGTGVRVGGTSQAFVITLPNAPTCDPIDFNNDSLFPADEDFIDFLSVLAGGSCSTGNTCNEIDFNNDGLFPDDTDLIAFLTVFAGGSCS